MGLLLTVGMVLFIIHIPVAIWNEPYKYKDEDRTKTMKSYKIGKAPSNLGLYKFIGKTVRRDYSFVDYHYCKFSSSFDTEEGSAILKGFYNIASRIYDNGISGYTLSLDRYRTSHTKYKDKFWDKLPDTINEEDLRLWYRESMKKAVYIRTDEIYAFDLKVKEFLNDFSGDYDKEFLDILSSVYEQYLDDPNHYLYVNGKTVKVFDKPPIHTLCINVDKFSFNKEMFRRSVET